MLIYVGDRSTGPARIDTPQTLMLTIGPSGTWYHLFEDGQKVQWGVVRSERGAMATPVIARFLPGYSDGGSPGVTTSQSPSSADQQTSGLSTMS